MGDVTRVLFSLGGIAVTGVVEWPATELEVYVRVARREAGCPCCETFSSRVKE